MVKIIATQGTTCVRIVGQGITVGDAFALDGGVTVTSALPPTSADAVAAACTDFVDYAAVVSGAEIATFALEVTSPHGIQDLTKKAWNALWVFHLLSVAAGVPCMPLYSISEGGTPAYSLVTRTPFVPRLGEIRPLAPERAAWTRQHEKSFGALIADERFKAAMLCFGNAHYLPDLQVRIMLLWSGIEGLLSVEAELNRRLALYATLLIGGSHDERADYFQRVKRAYGLRSKAVHGASLSGPKKSEGYAAASAILVALLARCVELGRVPAADEFDRAAVAGEIS